MGRIEDPTDQIASSGRASLGRIGVSVWSFEADAKGGHPRSVARRFLAPDPGCLEPGPSVLDTMGLGNRVLPMHAEGFPPPGFRADWVPDALPTSATGHNQIMSFSDGTAALDDLPDLGGRAERLLGITLRLTRLRDPDALLDFIIETAVDLLECEAASILLYDEATEKLRFEAATGSDPDTLHKIPVPLDDSIAGSIFTTNEPVVIEDAAQDQRHFDDVDEEVGFQTRSLVGVPMRIEDEPVGVLEGLNKTDGAFTENDVTTLTVLAAQAAVAIRNARQMRALEEANTQLSRLDALKSDFLALASHELRTPIAKIKGFGEILDDEADEDLQSHVARILEATADMEEVVDTMSQMEALRTGSDVLSRRSVVLQDVVRDALGETETLADERGHEVTVDLPSAPIELQGDPQRLGVVFSHVLTNAFVYTPENGRVRVDLERGEGEATVVVRDSDIGIPDEELERIFDDFYQVEDSLTRQYGGLGLGLTIARKLVQLHDGRIWAESAGSGEGASLHVRLPVDGNSADS